MPIVPAAAMLFVRARYKVPTGRFTGPATPTRIWFTSAEKFPRPDRGYWAKKQAGKPTIQISIPKRPPGMNDEVLLGAGNNNYYPYGSRTEEELLGPLRPTPEFTESLEQVRESIKKRS